MATREEMLELQELNEFIARRSSIDQIACACALKARRMVEIGLIEVERTCVLSGCVTAHVARIHRSRGDITPQQLTKVTESEDVPTCQNFDCVCHPKFDEEHRPESTDLVDNLIRGSHHIPKPTSS
jgi:hypothetical protein